MESRRKKSGDKLGGKSKPVALEESEIVIPVGFRCPITLDLMKDPVILSTGITYDRQSIETWLEGGSFTCPVTNQPLQSADLIPNHALRRMIQNWCVENPAAGIERIPTPRIPTTRSQVAEILSQVESASRRGSPASCVAVADKIRLLAKESERNRRCLAGTGAGAALTAAFAAVCDRFADSDTEYAPAAAAEAILAAMNAVATIDSEAWSHLWTRSCMRRLARLVSGGSLEGVGNAAWALREVLRNDEKLLEGDNRKILESTPQLVEGLVRVVREPICPATTKASLDVIVRIASASDRMVYRVVEAGLVPVLLEILPDCERGACEKALAALDLACSRHEGREQAYCHALAVPVLVKRMLRVSGVATGLALSVVWRLCKGARGEEVVMEALSVGLFHKLLVLLQVECDDGAKEKAKDLLKMSNKYKDKIECVDSGDFKNLKRPA
ncbi:unnamed protein product [Victoria cruziana]